MKMRCIDLHIHTTASDGTDTPEQIVTRALELNLAAIAITDHDTVSGIAAAQAAAAGTGLRVIPGIEISSDWNGHRAHIVGLFIDPNSDALLPAINWALPERARRNRAIIDQIAAAGYDISYEALLAANPGSVLGRPHIARRMIELGMVSSVKEAFDNYIDKGGKYYVKKNNIPLKDAVICIRGAGGIAVAAHPMQYGYDDKTREAYLANAKAAGCTALEAYYSEHTADQQQLMLDTAARLGLAVSGGSDYHGSNKPHIALARGMKDRPALTIPESLLTKLEAAR